MTLSGELPWTFVVSGIQQVRGENAARHVLPLVISKSKTRIERSIAHPFLGDFLAVEMCVCVGVDRRWEGAC